MSLSGAKFTFTQDVIVTAEFVLENYFSNPYKDNFKHDGRSQGYSKPWIERPVHGLIHSLRTVAYAPMYLALLKKQHPKEYKHIDDKELQKIMIAQLFFVAGRESEDSDGPSYIRYHEAGAQYFEDYAKQHLTHLFSKQDIIKYRDIIADNKNAVGSKYTNSSEANIVRLAHAVELMRARTPDELFMEAEPDHAGGFPGLGRGQMQRFNDANVASQICQYVLDLFEATGDMVPQYDIGPGTAYVINEIKKDKNGNKKKRLDSEGKLAWDSYNITKYNKEDVPIFKRKGVEANAKLFEECQYSVKRCLEQIASMKPPFDMNYEFEGIKAPIKSQKVEPKVQKEKVESKELQQLRLQEKKLAEEVENLNKNLRHLDGMEAFVALQEKELEELREQIKNLAGPEEVISIKPSKMHWGAREYNVIAENELCKDGEVRDKVLIPLDHNCCFNAVLVAAKHAGVQLPDGITNHYELRKAAVKRLGEEFNTFLQIYNQGAGEDFRLHAQPMIEEVYPRMIKDYNKEFGTKITSIPEYMEHIQKLNTWGGALELGIMAKILNVKIVNHSPESPRPLTVNDDAANEIHLEHTGYHFNVYVQPGTWHPLAENDPVILFDKQVHTQQRKDLQKKEKIQPEKQQFQGLPISYMNYLEVSHAVKSLLEQMQICRELLELKDLSKEKVTELANELYQLESEYTKANKQLTVMREKFKQNPQLDKTMKERLAVLAKMHDQYMEELTTFENELTGIRVEKEYLQSNKGKNVSELAKLKEKRQDLKEELERAKKNIAKDIFEIDKEIAFILREGGPSINEERYDQIAKHIQRGLTAKAKLAPSQKKKIVDKKVKAAKTVSETHLEQFLGARYNPNLSIEENIKLFFQNPDVKSMIHNGGPVGGIGKLNDPDAEILFEPEAGDLQYVKPGKYNERIINHCMKELKKMVENEKKNPGTYPLYHGLDAKKCVGNDVIKQLSSLLNDKDYGSMFRLFSDAFKYKDAEEFRQDIFVNKKLHDMVWDPRNPNLATEYHSRAISCAISPFQAKPQESPLDFWIHNANMSAFDRWENEILPKLKVVISEQKQLSILKKEYEELVELSSQLGSRMNQFLLTGEDINKYAWACGGYGYSMPSVAKLNNKVVETNKLSEALDYYKASPQEFITDAHKKVNDTIKDPSKKDDFVDYNNNDNIKKAYDGEYNNPEDARKYLNQMQARLYVHPELFEPGVMQVNTYYSLPTTPLMVEKYNKKVEAFSQRLCSIVLQAKQEGRLQQEEAPDELKESIIGLRPFKYVSEEKHKKALAKLKEMADILPKESDKRQTSELYSKVYASSETIPQLIAGNPANLSESLFYAIINGDNETFDALIQYYLSSQYDANSNPIDFNALSNKNEVSTAILLAAKYNQAPMIDRLLALKSNESVFAQAARFISRDATPTINIGRTVTEKDSGNTPLHYLAQNANTDAFLSFAKSLVVNWNYGSFLNYQGMTTNKNNNTPLHILAFNDPEVGKNRLEILETLLQSDYYEKLFGKDALITPNNQGLSPIMVAALTQNQDAIEMMSKKLGLSENQKAIYLWVASSPDKLTDIQRNQKYFGNIPGFITANWQIPEEIKGFKAQGMSVAEKPLTIEQLKNNLNMALSGEENDDILHCYDELKAAIDVKANDFVYELVKSKVAKNQANELQALIQLVESRAIPPSSDGINIITPAKEGHLKTVDLLLKARDKLGVKRTLQDQSGKTALHYLAQLDDPNSDEIIVDLLRAKSLTTDPTAMQDLEGNNFVHVLAKLGKDQILTAINEVFKTKQTMIYYAHEGVYEKLYNASLQPNKDGKTPIMVALTDNPANEDLIKLLAKALGLDNANIELYLQLARAIHSNNDDRIRRAIMDLNKNDSTLQISQVNKYGWNSTQGTIANIKRDVQESRKAANRNKI